MNERESKENAVKLVLCDMITEMSHDLFRPGIGKRMIEKYAPVIALAVEQVEKTREFAV